jgi:LysR family glycine cleavage system transcriptional activator
VTNKLAFLPYLRAFEAVSRLGTLRGAADELHLSPSAISLQLKKLSNITGVQLFARTGRNVTLTETGHEFYQSVSDALGTLADLVRLAVEREGEPKERSLSVSLPPSIGIAWLTAAIVEFATSRNMTSLSINQAVTCAEVDWHANDIAVVYDQPPFPGKRWELLSEVRLCAVCAPTLLGRMDLHSRDRKLHGFALLHEDGGEQWSRWSLAARVKLSDNIRVKVPSAAHCLALRCGHASSLGRGQSGSAIRNDVRGNQRLLSRVEGRKQCRRTYDSTRRIFTGIPEKKLEQAQAWFRLTRLFILRYIKPSSAPYGTCDR